jgi:hypothetical protein
MEKKTLRAAILALILISGTQVAAKNLIVQRSADCGMWLDARKSQNKSPVALEHFANGLVNGISLGSGIEIWNAQGKKTTPAQLYYWIDAYCTRKPLDDVYEAVFEFVDERTGGEWKRTFKK